MLCTDVVTAFVCYKGRILLVHRSPCMPSYAGKWGAISGSIMPGEDAATAAIREVWEETAIPSDALSQHASAPPLRVGEGERCWCVHPFLFSSSTGTVRLNEENTEYRWILPEELSRFDVVDGLVTAYASLTY
jgi:8-oxo-dGTP pyrophosphatase MutT (NUDIX family)